MSLPREQSIFAWCFITPFPFAVKCCWKLIFSSVFWSLSRQKDQPKFSEMLQVQHYTLPFVPYAKIKLICVVLKSDTAPWTFACCFLSSLYTSITFRAPFLPYHGDLPRFLFGETCSWENMSNILKEEQMGNETSWKHSCLCFSCVWIISII